MIFYRRKKAPYSRTRLSVLGSTFFILLPLLERAQMEQLRDMNVRVDRSVIRV